MSKILVPAELANVVILIARREVQSTSRKFGVFFEGLAEAVGAASNVTIGVSGDDDAAISDMLPHLALGLAYTALKITGAAASLAPQQYRLFLETIAEVVGAYECLRVSSVNQPTNAGGDDEPEEWMVAFQSTVDTSPDGGFVGQYDHDVSVESWLADIDAKNTHLMPNGRWLSFNPDTGYVSGKVRVELNEMIGVDLDGFLDMISERLTGSVCLSDVSYEIVGLSGQTPVLLVTGDPQMIIECEAAA